MGIGSLSGYVASSLTWLVAIQVTPGMPDRIEETLSIRVAHFQAQVVTLLGEGVYPSLSLTLPRVRSPEYQQALVEAQESLQRAAAAKPEVVPRYAHRLLPNGSSWHTLYHSTACTPT